MNKLFYIFSFIFFGFTGMNGQTVNTILAPNGPINDAIVVDSIGNIYGSDFNQSSNFSSAVYKIDTAGNVSTFSSGYSSANGLAFDHQGRLYVVDFTAISANHQVYQLDENGVRTPYGPTVSGASGIIFDPLSDTLFVSQYTNTSNRISKLAPDGSVSLFNNDAQLNGPVGMAFDDDNEFYVANFNDGKIFRISRDGQTLTLIADLPNVSFWGVGFLCYANGYLFATGIGTHKIYQVSLSGDVTELAGSGSPGYLDGVGSEARFNRPNGIATNMAQDRLYISEWQNYALREITFDPLTRIDSPEFSSIESLAIFPNPADEGTRLSYSLVEAGDVELSIKRIDGAIIQTIYSGSQSRGVQQIDIATSDLNAGIYIVQLNFGSEIKSIKLLVSH